MQPGGKDDGGFFGLFSCLGEKKKKEDGGSGSRWDTVERSFLCDCKRDASQRDPKPIRGVPTLSQRTENVAGVGIVFHEALTRDEGLIVEDIVQNGPAHKAGNVEPGLRLVSIDGRTVTLMRSEEIAPLILGEPGSEVTLGFVKPNGEQTTVKMVREVVRR